MITNARCESTIQPLGVDIENPMFSWNYEIGNVPLYQKSYRITVYNGNQLCWDSGIIKSRSTINIEYGGAALESITFYTWNIYTVDTKGIEHSLENNKFCTGFLNNEQKHKWVCHPGLTDNPVFYGDFFVKENLEYCITVISGLGYYKYSINDKEAHSSENVPGWTDYSKRNLDSLLYPYIDKSDKRILYNVHDITSSVNKGLNRFNAMLGNGFFNQVERLIEGDISYGHPRLLLEIHMIYSDGSRDIYKADKTTYCTEGPLEFNNIYFGETRNDNIGMSFDGGTNALELDWEHGNLECQFNSFDNVLGIIKPVRISNEIYDTGKNLTGRVRVKAKGPRGAKFTITYFDALKENEPDFNPTGGDWQIQENKYIFGTSDSITYRETFGWRGFKYFKIEKDPDVVLEEVVVEEIYGCSKGRNYFNCSDEIIEWIYNAYIQSQISNMHGGVPSDCPHRERLGYTGDGQVTCESALLSLDSIAFYKKWFDDIVLSQNSETGFIPHTVPFSGGGGGPAWGSACAIVPWLLYKYTFDIRIIKKAYPVIQKWIKYLLDKNPGLIIEKEEEGSWCLGDWCLPVEGYGVHNVTLDNIFDAMEPALVNTGYFYECIKICENIGILLGRDTEFYKRLAKRVKKKFNDRYLNKVTNTYGKGDFCSNVYPLAFKMVPEEIRTKCAASLNDYIKKTGFHMMLGIFGTSLIFDVLKEFGYEDTIEALLSQEEFPSFGYMKLCGATTLWETWEGKASLNHPMFGGPVAFFKKSTAGIKYISKDGRILFEPNFFSKLKYASTGIETVFGLVEIKWIKIDGGTKIKISTKIPGNTKAVLNTQGKAIILENGENETVIKMTESGNK